jgi:hypothetical protein
MASVRILDRDIPVTFKLGAGASASLDETVLLSGLEEMAALIAEKRSKLTDEELTAYAAMDGIVFFEGEVIVNGFRLTRPGCDEDDALFYWEANEFLANPDADVHGAIFFHDCCHVIQFRADGFAMVEDERVRRELDALDRQMVVAEKLGCSEAEIVFWRNFRNDQQVVLARLREGVERMIHHQDQGFA